MLYRTFIGIGLLATISGSAAPQIFKALGNANSLVDVTCATPSYTSGVVAGTLICALGNVASGATVAPTPSTDFHTVVEGNNLRVGLNAPTGNFNVTLRQTKIGVSNSPKDTVVAIMVNAAPAASPVVSNTRQAITSVTEIVAGSPTTNADTTALVASSSGLTKPSVSINAAATRQFAFNIGAQANGSLINYITSTDDSLVTYVFDYSDNSTNGVDGSWTTVATLNYAFVSENGPRGAVNPFPSGASGRYVRILITNGTGAAITSQLAVYGKNAPGTPMDIGAIFGDSITIGDLGPNRLELYTKSLDATRDPIVVNFGVHGYGMTLMTSNEVPLLATAITAGVPFGYAVLTASVNDIAHTRPQATDANAGDIATNAEAFQAAVVSAGIPEAMQFFSDISWENFSLPTANSIATAANGSSPYNDLNLWPYLQGRTFSATLSFAFGIPYIGQFTFTTNWLEVFAADTTTHPLGAFYFENIARLAPMVRYLSGLSTGRSYVEQLIVENYLAGVAISYTKQRLTDQLSLFPTTAAAVATALRAQATAMIATISTTLSGYADPGGVVLPNARSVTLTSWWDAAKQANVTFLNSTSAFVTQFADRSGNNYTCSINSNGMVLNLTNHANNYSHMRGVNQNQLSPGTRVAGYLPCDQSAFWTLLDAQANFSIEIYMRSYGVQTTGAIFGLTNLIVEPVSPTYPNLPGALKVTADSSASMTCSVAPVLEVSTYYAITYVASTHVWTLYKDGSSCATMTHTKPVWTTTAGAFMGRATGTTKSMDDLLEATTYSGVLSASDIANGRTYGQVKWNTP